MKREPGFWPIVLMTVAIMALVGTLVWFGWEAATAVRLLHEQTNRAIDQAAIENAALGDVLNRIDATNESILKALRGLRIDCGRTGAVLTCRLRVPKVKQASTTGPAPPPTTPPTTQPPPTTTPTPTPRKLPSNCKIVGKAPHRKLVCQERGKP